MPLAPNPPKGITPAAPVVGRLWCMTPAGTARKHCSNIVLPPPRRHRPGTIAARPEPLQHVRTHCSTSGGNPASYQAASIVSATPVANSLGLTTTGFPASNSGMIWPPDRCRGMAVRGQRRPLPAVLPGGVIVDTRVCGGAPRPLLLSGVGNLVAKFTAVTDWKLAFHALGDPVNDFACLFSVNLLRSDPRLAACFID